MGSDQEWRWWLLIIFYSCGSIIGLIIATIHTRNVYIDLSKKIKTTLTSRVFSITLTMSLYFYVLGMIIMFTFLMEQLTKYCKYSIIITSWTYFMSKMFMYLSFIARLCSVYNNPIYHYNLNILKIFGAFAIIFAVVLCILITIDTEPWTYYGEKKYVSFCQVGIPTYMTIINGLYEISFSMGSMIAFLNPLRQLIKSILKSNITKKEIDELTPLIKISVKYSILTSIASLSTFLFMISIALGFSFTAPIDFITNMSCMVLMTPYYTNKKIYEKLCCLTIRFSHNCLKCCCGYNQGAFRLNININIKPVNSTSEVTDKDQLSSKDPSDNVEKSSL